MADSNIQLNTDGTGKKLDTRTESTNLEHRQVFVIGDPAANTGVAPVDGTKGLAVDLTATGANATAIKVDGSAVTQPVSGTVTANLGTIAGVSTAAKQPALGTAGTASADVLTVQGITSMTPLKTDGSGVTQPVSGTVTASNVAGDVAAAATDSGNPVKVGAKFNATSPTYIDGQRGDLQIDARGTLKIVTANGTNTQNFKADNADAVAVSTTIDKPVIVSRGSVYNGTTWDRMPGDTTGVKIQPNSATGSAVPANGFYSSGQAKTSLPAAASDGNLTGAMFDKFGRQVVLIDGIRDIAGTQTTTISASTAETTIGTAAASTFLDLTSVLISNTSASATRVDFRDTTGGSVIFSLYVPAGDTRGFVVHTPIPQTTVNTNWTAQSSASVTDLRVFVKFIKNK